MEGKLMENKDKEVKAITDYKFRKRKKLVAKEGRKRPIQLYDRVKFLIGIGIVFGFLTFSMKSRNPLFTYADAGSTVVSDWPWLVWGFVLDFIRQTHYLLAENSKLYFTLFNKILTLLKIPTSNLNPVTRFKLSRIFTSFVFFLLIGTVLAKLTNGGDPLSGWTNTISLIWSNMSTLIQGLVYAALAILQFVGIFWFMSKGGVTVSMPDDIKTKFDMVWGQDRVVERVRETVKFLEEPERIESFGGYVPTGILLWGPPGTGKTLIAEAIAGETGKPFVAVEPGAFQAMFIGVNILKVRSLYKKLRKLSLRYGGVVVFFDEADSLGRRQPRGNSGPFGSSSSRRNDSCLTSELLDTEVAIRDYVKHDSDNENISKIVSGGMMAGGDLGTLNSLLAQIQGLDKPRGLVNRLRKAIGMQPSKAAKYRILHVMATNMPDSLDEALLRPGRIDRHFKVGYPSLEGRIRTFNGYLDKVKHTLTQDDVYRLATSSPRASGAVIKDIVNEALMAAIFDNRDTVTWQDVTKAKSFKTYGMPEDNIYNDRYRHHVAVHEASHAILAYKKLTNCHIDIATIEGRGDAGGFVAWVDKNEFGNGWKSQLDARILVALASTAGERYFFDGENAMGVSGDLESATRTALFMEANVAMGSALSSHEVLMNGGAGPAGSFRTDEKSKEKAMLNLGERVERKLQSLYKVAFDVIKTNRNIVLSIAHALEAHGTISGKDIEAIIENTQGPTVDGRLYHKPANKKLLENYHARSLKAHSEGVDGVDVPTLS